AAALAVEPEDVLVCSPVLDDLLALLRLLDRLDLVPEPSRLLEALVLGGRIHPPVEVPDDLAVAALEEQHDLSQVLLVRFTVHGEDARAETALDVVLDARTAPVPEHGIAAGTEREHLADRVERVADR